MIHGERINLLKMPENILWRAQRPLLTHIYTHIQNNNKEKNKNRDIHITHRNTLLAVPDGNPQQCWFITKTWRGGGRNRGQWYYFFFQPRPFTHSNTLPTSRTHRSTLGRDVRGGPPPNERRR